MEVEAFGLDYHPCLVALKIRVAGLCCLHPTVHKAMQVVEAMLLEHYIAILPFKPKTWVMCHQPETLEEAVVLIEAYASTEAGAYLIPKSCQGQVEKKGAR